jgi:hypothetical protein
MEGGAMKQWYLTENLIAQEHFFLLKNCSHEMLKKYMKKITGRLAVCQLLNK